MQIAMDRRRQMNQRPALSVAWIDLERDHCAIFSEVEGNLHQMDRINVALCHPADEGR